MSSRIARLLGVVTGLTAVALFFAAQANAATTWTVSAGSAAKGTVVKVSGHTVGTKPQIHFTDVTSAQKMTCVSGTASGTTTVGSGLAGAKIGQLNAANGTFNGCIGPSGLTFTITGSGTWYLNALSYTAPVTTGTITNIHASVVDPGVCSFNGSGFVRGTYNNTTHDLTSTGKTATLTVSNVSGCLGLIHDQDKAKLRGKFHITANRPAFNPVKITSP